MDAEEAEGAEVINAGSAGLAEHSRRRAPRG